MEKSFQFALQAIDPTVKTGENRLFAIANQLLKSRTSTGANIREAQ